MFEDWIKEKQTCLDHDIEKDFDTNFVKHHFDPADLNKFDDQEAEVASKLAFYLLEKGNILSEAKTTKAKSSKWKDRAKL